MFLNILLFFLIFVVAKKKFSLLGGALTLGAVKAAFYYYTSRNIALTAVVFVGITIVSAALVYFLTRVDKPPGDGAEKKGGFKWEYIAIVVAAFLFLFGEFVFGLRAMALTSLY